MNKAIWIDLDNSPHVPLFAPIIKHYRDRGIEVVVTARDHSQTLELLNLEGFNGTYSVIGKHYGANKLNKIRGLLVRAKQLALDIRKQRDDIAVAISHGSRSMVLAAWWLKIPVITMFDYEFNETHIFSRFSDKVLTPDRIPDSVLDAIGLPPHKRVKYPGIKEDLYINRFRPKQNFREELFTHCGIDGNNKTLVVLRPPATTANYHDAYSEVLLTAIIKRLIGPDSDDVFTIISPRTQEQAGEIRELINANKDLKSNYAILDEAVEGLDLIYAADLVISGGGTMNREAVLLGVPVYSSFAGPQGSLDKQMESEGSITFIREAADAEKIILKPRERNVFSNVLTENVEKFVIKQIDEFLNV